MPDSSAIENALIAKLLADTALMAITSDGVFWDEAAPGNTKFVIVSLVDEHDEMQFGGRSFEDALFLVKAVALSTSGANIQTAAARIDAVLDGGTLAPSGYTLMVMQREARVRATEVDAVDPAIRWQHRGGHYRVMMAPV
jgi:hypothetical protein